MGGYPNQKNGDFGLPKDDRDWLENIGAIYEIEDCNGHEIGCGMNLGPLRQILERVFPNARTMEDYVNEITLITGNVPISGAAWLQGFNDMDLFQCDLFFKALLSSDAGNSLRQGQDKKLFENDAV